MPPCLTDCMIQALPLPLLPQLPQLVHPLQLQIPSKMARIQIKKKNRPMAFWPTRMTGFVTCDLFRI